jgi:hypothetical protein
MSELPSQLWDAVKDNVVVQWFLVVVVILTVGTQTATKLKGPIGKLARAVQSFGEKRVNREAEERRQARQQLLRDAKEGRAWAEDQINGLKGRVEELASTLESFEVLVREHLGWDYDRVHQLINLGVRPSDIPAAPPLRMPWRSTETAAYVEDAERTERAEHETQVSEVRFAEPRPGEGGLALPAE